MFSMHVVNKPTKHSSVFGKARYAQPRRSGGTPICLGSRAKIAKHLLAECQRCYGSKRCSTLEAPSAFETNGKSDEGPGRERDGYGHVDMHFGMKLVGGDVFAGSLEFENVATGAHGAEKRSVMVEADLIIGADGAGSRTRSLLAAQVLSALNRFW
jgi:2-polyprenyl-6-methoxyphenol hydroxylase-like FAD-dependent oxidoreductase